MKIRDVVPNRYPDLASTTTCSIDNLPSFVSSSRNVDLSPPFQRGSVWTEPQKKAFVEHISAGGCTTPIILNCPTWQGFEAVDGSDLPPDDLQVVDGKQRLEALLDFMADKFKIYDGYKYSDFKEDCKYPFGGLNLTFAITRCSFFKELVEFYIALNFAGTSHTEDEFKALREMIV